MPFASLPVMCARSESDTKMCGSSSGDGLKEAEGTEVEVTDVEVTEAGVKEAGAEASGVAAAAGGEETSGG